MNRLRFAIISSFLFWILIVCSALAAFTQDANDEDAFFDGTYNKEYIKKHKVKTITTEQYMNEIKGGKAVYSFDRNGLLQSMIAIDTNGTEQAWYYFSFDAHGNLSSIISRHLGIDRSDTVRALVVYQGQLLVQEKAPSAFFPTYHFYNEKGQRIASENNYINGWITPSKRKLRYVYDERERLTHITERIADSATDSTLQWISDRTYSYPSRTLTLVEEKVPNGYIPSNKGNLTIRYDRKGNLVSKESDAVVSRYYTYNRKGLMLNKLEKFPATFEDATNLKFETRYQYTFW